jgi:uncharacterized membrane protein YtjA (UPF0391 family)
MDSGIDIDNPAYRRMNKKDPAEANQFSRRDAMLHYALVFLVIALIAAVLGFGGIAGAAAGIAKILFLVFVVLFLVSLIAGGVRGRRW